MSARPAPLRAAGLAYDRRGGTSSSPTVLRRGRLAARAAAPLAPVLLRPRALRAAGFRSMSRAPGAIGYDDAVEAVRRQTAARAEVGR